MKCTLCKKDICTHTNNSVKEIGQDTEDSNNRLYKMACRDCEFEQHVTKTNLNNFKIPLYQMLCEFKGKDKDSVICYDTFQPVCYECFKKRTRFDCHLKVSDIE